MAYICVLSLLLAILAVSLNASGFCLKASSTSSQSTRNGYYEPTGSTYGDKPYYSLTDIDATCSLGSSLMYYKDSRSRWYLGETVPPQSNYYFSRCASTSTTPSNCAEWDHTGMEVISGTCPIFGCDSIAVTNSGTWFCNGLYTKEENNLYYNSDTSSYWSFSDINQKWICSRSDQRRKCQVSINSWQLTEGWLQSTTQTVAVSTYVCDICDGSDNRYETFQSNFQCNGGGGGSVTPAPTPSTPTPVEPEPSVTDEKFCVLGGFVGGEYASTGSTYNGEPYFEITNMGPGCSNYYTTQLLYKESDNLQWHVGESLPPQSGIYYYWIKCTQSSTSPSNCLSWTDSDVSVTSGSCPQFGCSNIKVTGSGRYDCDGLFLKSEDNLYFNSDNSKYWSFSQKSNKWICNSNDQRTRCGITISSQQNIAGWFNMIDGSTQSVQLLSYVCPGGNCQDQVYDSTFDCGVEITPSPTASDEDLCLCSSSWLGGLYSKRVSDFNSQPTYEKNGLYIYYSSLYKRWIVNDQIDNTDGTVKTFGPANENDILVALQDYNPSYGECDQRCPISANSEISNHFIDIAADKMNDNNFFDKLKTKSGAIVMLSLFVIGMLWAIAICIYQCGCCKGGSNTNTPPTKGYSKANIANA